LSRAGADAAPTGKTKGERAMLTTIAVLFVVLMTPFVIFAPSLHTIDR
jgi:hypothetical protein